LKDSRAIYCKRFYYSRNLPKLIERQKEVNSYLMKVAEDIKAIAFEDVKINPERIHKKLRKLLNGDLTKSNEENLISVFVPYNERVFINETNSLKVLKHHIKMFIYKPVPEQKEFLIKSLSEGENYFKTYLENLLGLSKTLVRAVAYRKITKNLKNFPEYLQRMENKFNK
jgi:hypothetical protein